MLNLRGCGRSTLLAEQIAEWDEKFSSGDGERHSVGNPITRCNDDLMKVRKSAECKQPKTVRCSIDYGRLIFSTRRLSAEVVKQNVVENQASYTSALVLQYFRHD